MCSIEKKLFYSKFQVALPAELLSIESGSGTKDTRHVVDPEVACHSRLFRQEAVRQILELPGAADVVPDVGILRYIANESALGLFLRDDVAEKNVLAVRDGCHERQDQKRGLDPCTGSRQDV